jgi:hypothetical protein
MPSKDSKLEKAREVVDILEEISMLLVCVSLKSATLVNASLIKRAEYAARPFPAILVCLSH